MCFTQSLNYYFFLCLLTAPKPPLLSLACTNQIPVLNWTEVVYGYYNPLALCVEHTCHSDNTSNTTVSTLVHKESKHASYKHVVIIITYYSPSRCKTCVDFSK